MRPEPRSNVRKPFALFAVVAAVLLACSVQAHAQTATTSVYVTEHGKKYHTYADCRSLRSSTVKTIQLSAVGDRTLCTICQHRKAK